LIVAALALALTTAQGHDPAWSAQIDEKRFDFLAVDGTRFALDVDARPGASPLQLGLQVRGEPLLLRVDAQPCHDLKTGRPFPWRVSVTFAGRVFHGCGGEPGWLLQGRDWSMGEAMPRLRFEADGRFSAQLACNTLAGRWRADAQGLSLQPGPMTRRACWSNEANLLEQRTLEQLGRVWAFELGEAGALRLRLTDGSALSLQP
jgi:uncharacterized membrane protein